MNRPREIEQIEATLGRTFTTRTLGPYSAFHSLLHSPLPERIGSLTAIELSNWQSNEREEVRKVTEALAEHCLPWSAMGYTVFLGLLDDVEPNAVYAIVDADPIQLMDLFKVGSYNDVTGNTPDRAKRYMAKLFKTDPFVPYLVDAANLRVRFINPVSATRAGEIAQAVAEFDPDAYEFVSAYAYEREPAYEFANEPAGPESERQAEHRVDLLQRRILKRQELELWWD